MLFAFLYVVYVFIMLFLQSFILLAVCAYALGQRKGQPYLGPSLETMSGKRPTVAVIQVFPIFEGSGR